MKQSKKLFLVLGLILILAIVAYFGFTQLKSKPSQNYVVPAVPVEVIEVKSNKIPETIQVIGNIAANQQVDISPEDDGHIKKILFQNGQYITKGQTLVEMNAATVTADLSSEQAALNLASLKLKRLRALNLKSAISKQDLDQALSDYKQALAQVSKDQEAVDRTCLKAPFNGYIGARQFDIGQFIKAGDKIATLVDTHDVKMIYQVPADLRAKLQLGQDIHVKVGAYPKQKFIGKVNFISPYVDDVTRTITVQAVVDNPENLLLPGMFAQITQVFGIDADALVVPTASLVPTITGTIVYRVVNGRAVETSVVVGGYWDKEAQITSGLLLGDIVVMTGQQRLSDGKTVKIVPNTWKGYNA